MEDSQISKRVSAIQDFINIPHITFYTLTYLDIRESLKLMHLQKQLYKTISIYIKAFLINSGLIDPNSKEDLKQAVHTQMKLSNISRNSSYTSEIEQIVEQLLNQENIKNENIKYNLLLKTYYCRDILMTMLPKDKIINPKTLVFQKLEIVLGEGIKQCQIGSRFFAMKTYNDTLYFLKINELDQDPHLIDKEYLSKCCRTQVDKFFTTSKNLIYTNETGQVLVVFYDQNKLTSDLIENSLDVTKQFPVHSIDVSYNYIIAKFDQNIKKYVLPQEEIIQEKLEQEQNEYFYSVNIFDIKPESLNQKGRFRQIYGIPQDIIQFCVGAYHCYFIQEGGQLHEVVLGTPETNINQQQPLEYYQVQAHEFEFFSKNNFKSVKQIISGFHYYIALEQETNESLEFWDNEKVLKWISSQKDFEDYVSIIKYEKITGKDLINANKYYLIDTLGMKKEDIQTKFLTEISIHSRQTKKPVKLYGWGQNQNGQFGTLTKSAVINRPIKIPLPELGIHDEITDVICSLKNSSFITKKKRIFITDNFVKENEKEEEAPANQNKKETKTKSKIEEIPQSTNRWIELTKSIQFIKGSRKYDLIDITISNDHIGILAAYNTINSNSGINKKQVETEQEQDVPKEKLKEAEKVLNRILWDESLNKTEFSVGYEDRFLGIMEITAEQFKKSDIQYHRIKYFKKLGEIVWDKATRFSAL